MPSATTPVKAGNGHAHGHATTNVKTTGGGERPIDPVENTQTSAKHPTISDSTDKSRWRLLDDGGRQTWHYLEDDDKAKDWPQSDADKWYLGLPMVGNSGSCIDALC